MLQGQRLCCPRVGSSSVPCWYSHARRSASGKESLHKKDGILLIIEPDQARFTNPTLNRHLYYQNRKPDHGLGLLAYTKKSRPITGSRFVLKIETCLRASKPDHPCSRSS
jgi:hypothetical protein